HADFPGRSRATERQLEFCRGDGPAGTDRADQVIKANQDSLIWAEFQLLLAPEIAVLLVLVDRRVRAVPILVIADSLAMDRCAVLEHHCLVRRRGSGQKQAEQTGYLHESPSVDRLYRGSLPNQRALPRSPGWL